MGRRTVRTLSITVLAACGLPLLAVQPAHAAPAECVAGLESDFNGDGYSDAVVADPYATVGALSQAGRVRTSDRRSAPGWCSCSPGTAAP